MIALLYILIWGIGWNGVAIAIITLQEVKDEDVR
jgi:hypothetical protein